MAVYDPIEFHSFADVNTVPFSSTVMMLRSAHARTAMTVDNIPGWYEKVVYDGKLS